MQGTASGQRQKMNQGDTLIILLAVPTNGKAMWRGREKDASRYLPYHFLVWPRFSYSCSCIFFTKYERKTHQKKKKKKQSNKGLQATSHVCPPCHGPTKTTKVWVRTKIFLARKWLWSRDQKLWWPTTVTAKRKTSCQKQKHHGETKNLTAKTKYLTAKPKTSRQKQNTSRQNQKPHGKTKYFTAKAK